MMRDWKRAGRWPVLVCGIGVIAMSDSAAAPFRAVTDTSEQIWLAMSATPVASGIAIDCGDLPEPACAALAEGLTGRQTDTAWTVTIEMTRISGTFLEGRLVWQAAGGAPEKGPLLEVSVMDRAVGPDTYGRLATGLLKITELPF